MENRGGQIRSLDRGSQRQVIRSRRVTPPEVVRASEAVAPASSVKPTIRRGARGILIVNDRISVTRERYGSSGSVDPLHFHPQDAVVIYLRGGCVWPAAPFYGPDRVRRGDVRVVPGNVLHVTGNAGSDPLEFLLIIPQ